VYKTVGDSKLAADVYTPPDAPKDGRLPAVILIHGGPIASAMQPNDWASFSRSASSPPRQASSP